MEIELISKFFWWLLTVISVIVLVTLSVANRQLVRVVLDPFNSENPAWFVDNVPLFALILGSLIAGLVLGGIATWLTQAKWRRTARARTKESNRWRIEADRLARERDQQHQAQLASSSPN